MKGADMFSRFNPRSILVLSLMSVALISLGASADTDPVAPPASAEEQIDPGAQPMQGFLLEASEFLDQQQMAKLVDLIAESRLQDRGQRAQCDAPRRGSRGHGGHHFDRHHGGGHGRGACRADGPRGTRADRREAWVEQRQERGMERQEQRIAFLAELLDLSGEQRAEVESVMAGQHDRIQALSEEFREGLDGGRPTREQGNAHREAMEEIRQESRAAILETLDEEQAELFKAVEKLRPEQPGRRGGRGQGRGR